MAHGPSRQSKPNISYRNRKDKATNESRGCGEVPFGRRLYGSRVSLLSQATATSCRAHAMLHRHCNGIKFLTVMAALTGVVERISILPIVSLRPGLGLWYGLLGAHLGIHRGHQFNPDALISLLCGDLRRREGVGRWTTVLSRMVTREGGMAVGKASRTAGRRGKVPNGIC